MTFITREELLKFTNKVCDDNDPLPLKYCNSAMEMVADYLKYNPESQEYSQIIKGDDGELAALKAFPITAITTFGVDGTQHEVSELEVEKENYICFVDGSRFQKGVRYTLTYTAGYTALTMPEVIKTTALQIASLLWESAGGNLAVSSTSFADTGSRVFNNFTADRFLKQIAKYKMVF